MAYRHGVYKSEVPTSLVPPVRTEAGLPVVIGTAPVHLTDPKCVNVPKLVYTYSEAVEAFGFSKDWEKYSLCEYIYSQFALFGMSPCVLINVLDPGEHKTSVDPAAFAIESGKANLGEGVLLDSVTVSGDPAPVAGTDYALGYDDDGNAILSILSGGSLAEAESVTLGFDRVDPSQVASEDIIGGIDVATGKRTGLELVNEIFPKFRILPGLILSPGWSEKPEVAAVMLAKAENVNGHFTAQAICDIPSSTGNAETYTDVPGWKQNNNYAGERQIVCWPKIKLGDDVFHLSTQLAGLMNSIDADNEDVPYESPSNKNLQMNAMVNAAGEEISLGPEMANYLNGQGIVTALNWVGGWRAWGNRTACYPANTDPKDAFIPIRRMFDWLGNEFILTFWQKVDGPITLRLVRSIVNSFNVRLNGLAAREYLLGGRVVFSESENPLTDLMDGLLKFHLYVTPPPPAREIRGILEFDPQYFEALFD